MLFKEILSEPYETIKTLCEKNAVFLNAKAGSVYM
jgi:hypothetical protein